MKCKILVVDDDSDVLELLEYTLSNAGFEVIALCDTKYVQAILTQERIELIIMDRKLPDIEGSSYIEMLRNKQIDTPVIFLSAKGSPQEIKEGFLKGGDDYIVKPFDIEELVLRVKAIIKRYNVDEKQNSGIVEYMDLKLDLNRHTVSIGNQTVLLTNLEANLLYTLIKNKGRVLDREFLLKSVWKDDGSINPKTVNVAIKRLKEKIDPTNTKSYIKSIRGMGYMAF